MGSRTRENSDQFFPRYDTNRLGETSRVSRGPPAQNYKRDDGSRFRSTRDYQTGEGKANPSGRESDRNRSFQRRGPDQHAERFSGREASRRGSPRQPAAQSARVQMTPRNNDFLVRLNSRNEGSSSGSRYKYRDEGRYTDYEPDQPGRTPYQSNGRSRDCQGSSRNEYGVSTAPRASAPDRYRYNRDSAPVRRTGRDLGSHSYANSDVVMETRQLEERIAAIQQELQMLENDNTGTRSSDYRGSREAYPSSGGNRSLNSPLLPDFSASLAEKARLEREEESLRLREEQLMRREQELAMEQRRSRTPALNYGRVAAPSRMKTVTFPKVRDTRVITKRRGRGMGRVVRPPPQRAMESQRRRILDSKATFLANERRRGKEVKLPPKQRRLMKMREDKKKVEQEVRIKTDIGAEGSPKKSRAQEISRATEAMIIQILGDDEFDELPRTRSLKHMMEICDTSNLTEEARKQVEDFIVETPSGNEDYMLFDCPRSHNPTTLGLLDMFVPLKSFDEEVAVEESEEFESKEFLESLQSALAVFPRSPVV